MYLLPYEAEEFVLDHFKRMVMAELEMLVVEVIPFRLQRLIARIALSVHRRRTMHELDCQPPRVAEHCEDRPVLHGLDISHRNCPRVD